MSDTRSFHKPFTTVGAQVQPDWHVTRALPIPR